MEKLRKASLRNTEERNKLAITNHNLVYYVYRRYYLPKIYPVESYPMDMALSDGFLGLLRAAELYDPAHGGKFSTYAVGWIRQAMQTGYRKHHHLIRLPREKNTQPKFLRDSYTLHSIEERRSGQDVRRESVREGVHYALQKLYPVRDREIIKKRLEGMTLKEIGIQYGVTRERIRQREKRALRVLRKILQEMS